MTPMNLETISNLAWLAVSALVVFALGFDPQSQPFRRSKRVAMLFLIAVFAFPCISVSDDIWSLQAIPESRTTLRSGFQDEIKSTTWRLLQLFESFQSFALPPRLLLAALLSFLGVALSLSVGVTHRYMFGSPGRSPPVQASTF